MSRDNSSDQEPTDWQWSLTIEMIYDYNISPWGYSSILRNQKGAYPFGVPINPYWQNININWTGNKILPLS